MEKRQKRRLAEASMVGLTLLRLAGAGYMMRRVARHKGIAAPMAVFVALAIADGALARKLEVDTPLRRFTDAAVDHASVSGVALMTAKEHKEAGPYVAVLLAENAAMSLANLAHNRRTGEVVQGSGPLHTLGTLSAALFGVAANSESKLALHASGALAVAINAVRVLDYVTNAIEPHGTVEDGIRKIHFDNVRPQ
ncbi:MAG TPA: CDP-alcohol phosphatidyltransferase family protein [Candidatus Saccharimonadales bacterium]|nr:CDP-alcohol phosphatidyltransferase family protein [Candidatus Saccharimonadales bacterium]